MVGPVLNEQISRVVISPVMILAAASAMRFHYTLALYVDLHLLGTGGASGRPPCQYRIVWAAMLSIVRVLSRGTPLVKCIAGS